MALPNLFDLWRPALEASHIMAESHTVIGLRLAGMAGFWPMGQAETGRMMMEKLEAGALAAGAAFHAGMAGGNPTEIAMAAMKPVRRRTRANAHRLARKAGAKA